jgi:endoglucanase
MLKLLPGGAMAAAWGVSAPAAHADDGLRGAWRIFRDRFMAPEGRLLDTRNGGISHSEGQGWGMLCAVRTDDRASFELLHGWTMRVLKRPNDELFSWRFNPRAAQPVGDANNATDGDLFIAWALLEAGARWGHEGYTAQGTAMARDILRRLVRPVGGHVVLMPGLRGFERPQHTVINPSYYAFPAIRALAAAVPDPMWLHMAADGIALLRRARFGRWRLPPDWLMLGRLDGRVSPAHGWPARFSYDAVRVPLYMAWVGLAEEPGVTGPATFWNDRHQMAPGGIPAWADLSSDAISPYPASPGIAAVAQLARAIRAADGPFPFLETNRAIPPDYYSGALSLLAALAARDAGIV